MPTDGTVRLNCLTTSSGSFANAKLLISHSSADWFPSENNWISINLTVPSGRFEKMNNARPHLTAAKAMTGGDVMKSFQNGLLCCVGCNDKLTH